jgi:hypothetical protein
MKRKTINEKIIKALSTGRNFTTEQLVKRARTHAVSQRISELRQNGYPNIYTNQIRRNGKTVFAYRLGTPTDEMFNRANRGEIRLNWTA